MFNYILAIILTSLSGGLIFLYSYVVAINGLFMNSYGIFLVIFTINFILSIMTFIDKIPGKITKGVIMKSIITSIIGLAGTLFSITLIFGSLFS